jgi:hypothetical protein
MMVVKIFLFRLRMEIELQVQTTLLRRRGIHYYLTKRQRRDGALFITEILFKTANASRCVQLLAVYVLRLLSVLQQTLGNSYLYFQISVGFITEMKDTRKRECNTGINVRITPLSPFDSK